MSRPFAITAASNSVFLDKDRTGEARFTVSNQSGRPIKGQARLVPEESEVEEWVSVRGQAHRDFATAGTEQFTVDINVPRHASAGNYSLRLDMVGEERPDEQYVEGPAVTFQVPDAEPDPEPFPWKVVAAVVVLLLIGGGVLAGIIISNSDVTRVPDVADLSVDQATRELEASGFTIRGDSAVFDDVVDEGNVIRTEPAIGDTVVGTASVFLFHSLGPTNRNLSLEELHSGQHQTPLEASQRVMRDEPSFRQFWSELRGDQPHPGIDFEEDAVVYVALGSRTGFRVELNEAIHNRSSSQLQIHYTEYAPGRDCIVPQVVSYPYVIGVVEDVDADFEFIHLEDRYSC